MSFTFNQLTEVLQHANEAIVVFTKVDGTTRTLRCTLKKEQLPLQHQSNMAGMLIEGDGSDERLSVWDLDNGGWRSFRVSSVLSINVKSNC